MRPVLALLLLLSCSTPARAQPSSARASPDPSAAPNRAAAAQAYDRGSAFYLNRDYGRAARWFETAYRLAPAAPALVQAIRAQLRAGHRIRAANLALRLLGAHGDDAEARALAEEVLAEHGPSFFRLELDCEDCTLEVQGRVWSYPAAMLEPATEHRVVVSRGSARDEHVIRGERGERRVLSAPVELDAPGAAASQDPAPAHAATRAATNEDARPPASRMPLDPWVFGVGVGLTVVSAAVLIWSGVDTLDGVEAFEAMPTMAGFEAGEDKERRTNWLIAATVGLGALTFVAAIFTDWGGDEDAPRAGVFFDGTSGGGGVRGGF